MVLSVRKNMEMMNLYLLRHTRVDTPVGMCYGQTDVPLAESYPEELAQLQAKLEGVSFSHCFSSPLSRCRKLAGQLFPGEIRLDDRLRELNFGAWEGRLWSELEQTAEARKWFADYLNTPCPGGESYRYMLERIRSFLIDLSCLPPDSKVLVVTHGGPVRALLVHWYSMDPKEAFRFRVDYGELILLKENSELEKKEE